MLRIKGKRRGLEDYLPIWKADVKDRNVGAVEHNANVDWVAAHCIAGTPPLASPLGAAVPPPPQ